MRTRRSLAVTFVTLCAAAVMAMPAAARDGGNLGNPGVAPPQSTPYDLSYADWSVRWWKWAMAIPAATNPMVDTTGEYSATNQAGPVWFLAGTSGFLGPVTRDVTVPAGKALLFPLINYLNDYDPYNPSNPAGPGPLQPGQTLEEMLLPWANLVVGSTTVLEAEVDGVPLDNLWDYRATSQAFWFAADPSMTALDPVINPQGKLQPGLSDGFWVMLRPLPAGKHTIHWHSVSPVEEWGATFENDVTINLTVTAGKR